jgi:hypothetical protein
MKTIEIISQDVFDKIRSRFKNLQMGDEAGGVTMDPREARFFDFDFVIEDHNFGRVSISINELGTLKVFYGKSILEDIDTISRDFWYDFLREMRLFAMRRLLRFDTRDITKSNLEKDDFQYLAANGPKDETMNVSESVKFEGSSKTSYRVMERTKIIVKHKKPINDESFGARSRVHNIESIFIENEQGERYKMPVLWMPGAKAMQMHCAHGGKPYDGLGESINKMCEQVAQLSAFKRHMSRHDTMNKEVNEIAERAGMKLESLKQQAHRLSTRQGYREWAETFDPTATMQGMTEMDQATMEDYKSKFTVSSFKEDLAQFFPLIHSIMQETGTVELEDYVSETDGEKCNECGMWESQCTCDDNVKEGIFTKFEKWANAVTEGTLEPDTLYSLSKLLSDNADLTVGVDGDAGIEALEGIGVVSDSLEKLITAKAALDPNTPLKDVVGEWLAKDDPEAAQELGLVPAEPAPEADPAAVDIEQPMDEAAEDRTSYKVARYLFDKGLRYNPQNEKDIIKMIGGAMMKMGFSGKEVRYYISYDEDFLSDTLAELQHMEKAIDEVGVAEGEYQAGPKKMEVPAYQRKQQGGDWKTDVKDPEEKSKNISYRKPKDDVSNDDVEKELGKEEDKPSLKELAQWIGGHYNKNYKEEGFKSGFRKGPSELGVMAEKQFGPGYGDLVEKMVSDLDDTPLRRISRRADIRRAKEAEELQTGQLSPIHGESGMEESLNAIMRLAGLAK